MAGVQNGHPDGLGKTPFIADIDPEQCDYCGECLRACNAKCIGLGGGAEQNTADGARRRWAAIDTDVCLGCGVCLPVCERGAIRLEPRRDYRKPPGNSATLYARMLWEKGRLWPYLGAAAKRHLRIPTPWRR